MSLKLNHILTALLAVFPAVSFAGGVGDVVSASLLPGWRMENGHHMAGIRIELEPGWKTYWRSPGDAGIPPRFDWGLSDNVKGVAVHWPVPRAFDQNGMTSIGYSGDIVIPIEVMPLRSDGDVALDGRVEIGVCHDICIPVSLQIRAELPPGTTLQGSERISAALADRPLSAAEAGIGSVTCRTDQISDGMKLTVTLEMPQMAATETTVVEFSDPTVWVSAAETNRQGSRLVAVAELVPADAGPFALARDGLRFTILGDGQAVDVRGCSAG